MSPSYRPVFAFLTLVFPWLLCRPLPATDLSFILNLPLAEIYDEDGDGLRDARPVLDVPDDLELRLAWWENEVQVSRHTLTDPLRVMLERSDDLMDWERIAVLPPPLSPGEEGLLLAQAVPPPGDRAFYRSVAEDARLLDELTPETAHNLWARLMAGVVTVTNDAATKGNGTRGADTHGRVFGTGDYEVVTRTLWSVGAWFYHPGRTGTLTWTNPVDGSSGSVDVAAFARNAIRNGTSPDHPQRWPDTFNGGNLSTMQPSVEAANVGWAAWAMMRGHAVGNVHSPWGGFSATDRSQLNAWLALHGDVPGGSVNNGNIYNWNLFFVLNHEARKRMAAAGYGEFTWTQSQIDNARAAADALHRGGGWYSDFGTFNIYDNYNDWTFASHLLFHAHLGASDNNAATEIPGRPGRTRAVLLAELRDYLALTPSFYDIEGGNPEYGRSASYKLARLSGLLLAYAVDRLAATESPGTWTQPAFPDSISPGQLRRLVRVQLNHNLRNDMIHWPSGLIREGLTPDTAPGQLESYVIRGSTYWSMLLFASMWLIPDNDPFWSAPEEPLPAQTSDFSHWLDTPGWFLSHRRSRGDLRLYNLRNGYRTESWAEAQYHPKYAKFSYSSRFGYLLSAATRSDQMIRINDGSRQLPEAGDIFPNPQATAEQPPVLRTVHVQGGRRVSSLMFLRGDLEVRVHRVTGSEGAGKVVEGALPLGHAGGETPPAAVTGPDWTYLQSSRGAILHASLLGYTRVSTYPGTGNHSRDPAWRLMVAESLNAPVTGTFATLQCARATPFDPALVRALVSSVTHTATSATVHFSDGTQLSADFLP
ncbi:MAG: DUF2264 domain-containing protein [Opitutales bacterium]